MPMRYCTFLFLALVLLACQSKPQISIELYPAVLAPDPQAPAPQGWARVQFDGSGSAGTRTYHVRPDTLLTEWNILACRPASQPDGRMGAAVRLNAFGVRRMAQFSADPANLQKPMALKIDGRWADFSPLLDQPRDRMVLYGFTQEEVERLERYLAKR